MTRRIPFFRTLMGRRRLNKIFKYIGIFIASSFLLVLTIASVEETCPPEGCGKREFGSRDSFIQTFPDRKIRPNSQVKRILRWTGFFTDKTWEETDDSTFRPCKVNKCTMTNDRSLLDESDAVLFHVGPLWNFWRGSSLPGRRQPYQVWILYNVEPPPRVPLDMTLYQGVFNWTSWYRRDSDVPVAYGGYTHYPMPQSMKGNSMNINWARENNRHSAWMSSNCFDYNRRQTLVKELKKLMGEDLDLYGKCGGRKCKETICYDSISNYKFFFTFENANCRDYITEKFWAALLRRQVPVAFGGASPEDYAKIAPPHSFIHVKNYKDVPTLVKHLSYLSENETAYNEYLAWTKDHDVYSEIPARRKWWCDLCEALHDEKRPAQTYKDIVGWMKDDVCPQWSVANQIGRLVDGFKMKIGLL